METISTKNMNLIGSIDHIIDLLKKIRNITENNPENIVIKIEHNRDLKPYYELGKEKAYGFRQRGEETTCITISDRSNDGKVFKQNLAGCPSGLRRRS